MDPNTTKIRPSSARQRNAIVMAFRWRADDGPTLNAGLVALWFFRGSGPVLLRNPIFLWFFRGRLLPPPPPPSGPAHVGSVIRCMIGNHVLPLRSSGAVKLDFQPYIRKFYLPKWKFWIQFSPNCCWSAPLLL